jgi:hypothetical protein
MSVDAAKFVLLVRGTVAPIIVGEMELKASAVPQCSGGVAFASVNGGAGAMPAQAFDGNSTTGWSTGGRLSGMLGYGWGTLHTGVDHLEITVKTGSEGSAPKDILLLFVDPDSGELLPCLYATGLSWGAGETKSWSLGGLTSKTVWRVVPSGIDSGQSMMQVGNLLPDSYFGQVGSCLKATGAGKDVGQIVDSNSLSYFEANIGTSAVATNVDPNFWPFFFFDLNPSFTEFTVEVSSKEYAGFPSILSFDYWNGSDWINVASLVEPDVVPGKSYVVGIIPPVFTLDPDVSQVGRMVSAKGQALGASQVARLVSGELLQGVFGTEVGRLVVGRGGNAVVGTGAARMVSAIVYDMSERGSVVSVVSRIVSVRGEDVRVSALARLVSLKMVPLSPPEEVDMELYGRTFLYKVRRNDWQLYNDPAAREEIMPNVPEKMEDERIMLVVDFRDACNIEDRVRVVLDFSITTAFGKDGNPNFMVAKAPTLDDDMVYVGLQGGVPGCIYRIFCRVELAFGQRHVGVVYLPGGLDWIALFWLVGWLILLLMIGVG